MPWVGDGGRCPSWNTRSDMVSNAWAGRGPSRGPERAGGREAEAEIMLRPRKQDDITVVASWAGTSREGGL